MLHLQDEKMSKQVKMRFAILGVALQKLWDGWKSCVDTPVKKSKHQGPVEHKQLEPES